MTEESPASGASATAAEGAAADGNDWRLTVLVHGHDAAGAGSAAGPGQLAGHLSGRQVSADLQRQLGGRVAVGAGGSELFLYAGSEEAAAAARDSVSGLLAEHGLTADYQLDRWHPVAEDWEPADIALPGTAAEVAAERQRLDDEQTSESLAGGVALFEVRVQVAAHRDAVELAERLRADGYSVVRRWRFLVVGANNVDQAQDFATAIRGQAPPDAVISTEEVGPGRPYTPFEIAAGSGI